MNHAQSHSPAGAPSAGRPPGNGGPAENERLTGTVARITFENKENGYAVVKLQPEGQVPARYLMAGGLVVMIGVLPGIEVGQSILAEGEWTRDPKFGPQFKARWYKPMLPTGTAGIEVYLASGAVRGVGPVTAKKIVQAFGDKTFDVLDTQIDRLKEVPGLKSSKLLAKIKESWATARGDRELVTFLGDHGVSPAIAARLRRVYHDNALAVVRSNPYRLTTDVHGIGFHRADVIAQKIGLAAEAPERIEAALSHVLERQAEEGHTYQPRPRLEELTIELLKTIPQTLVAEILDAMIERGRVVVEQIEGEPAIFIKSLHDAEQRIAQALRVLMVSPKRLPRADAVGVLADFEQRTRFELAAAQREAVLTFARSGMLILTGGPGTGKTTTVRSIIEVFNQKGLAVKLAAPTGRAARRLSETAGLPAETIHRMLNYQAHQGKFGRDATNPVEADLVIVDEVSMLDAPLAAFLLEALSPRTCLMLVGDEDQLPSVGAGNVLGDLIASGVMPVVRLTEVFRQAGLSMIVTNAHRINKGLMPYLKPPQASAPGNAGALSTPEREPDFFFIEREDPFQVIDVIRTLVRERIPRKFHLDPHTDIQILTPMRRGDLGVDALNQAMKDLLNPVRAADPEPVIFAPDEDDDDDNGNGNVGGPDAPPGAPSDAVAEPPAGYGAPAGHRRRHGFDPGDRVMQTTNNYDKLVYNGDIGHVKHVDGDSGELLVQFEGRTVSYLIDELDQLTLAYAITIHKSQGSEYPVVIIPVHTQHWIMLQRNLIYTAITRARRLVCLVGKPFALRRAVTNAERAKRFTALGWFLRDDNLKPKGEGIL